MAKTRKNVDKDQLRQRRAELYEAITRGAMTLQQAVKEMRAISRLTQAEFAAHRGVSTKVIKEIEGGTGNPTVNTLNRIGAFFGLEVAFVRTEQLRGQHNAAPPPRAADEPARGLPADEARGIRQAMEDIKKILELYETPRQK
jgi:DNA-binding XRE family transcriptional regulator